MRICGLASCLIFSMIQLIQSREYARPSPTDMPYSQRDILNKKENMKNYLKTLKSFQLTPPELFNNETEHIGNLLVEDEKIRIPYSAKGLREVTKMYLDQGRLNRYLRILDMELERTPATIELDSSKIIDYVKMLNSMNKHEGKPADLVSRSRIKLMKGGINDNILYDDKTQEVNFYDDDYQIEKRDSDCKENYRSIYPSADNALFFDYPITNQKSEENFNQHTQKAVDSDFDFSRLGGDIAVNQFIESDKYNTNSDLDNQVWYEQIQRPDNEKKKSENIPANAFNGEEFYNIDSEPLDEEWSNLHMQIQPSSATEYSDLASAKDVMYDLKEPVGKNEVLQLSNKVEAEDINEKQAPFENKKRCDDRRANINGKRHVQVEDARMRTKLGRNSAALGTGVDLAKGNKPEPAGALLSNLQNKLYNMEIPINKSTRITDTSDNVSNVNNASLYQQFLQNLHNNMGLRKAIEFKTAAFFRNISVPNHSITKSPTKSESVSNGPPDHRIFPLKPEDEIINVPHTKYFEQCFNGENNDFHSNRGMPTKPPKMYSKYYMSRLKKFQKYDDDSGSLNFLKQPRMPLFGTKESELSKILNVNLDHLHIDKEALYKIIGKALKVDEENAHYNPPKWLENKYEELLHASHRGQNLNDYDYVVKSRHNLNLDHLLNIRDRKESIFQKNNTNV